MPQTLPQNNNTDIVIIGMSGRFGSADNLASFWEILREGKTLIEEIPTDRWDRNKFYDGNKSTGKSYSKWGSFLKDIDCFDPAYAPGTGTPVTGGLTSLAALEIIQGMTDINFTGMDLVEVSPAYDHGEITAILGAAVASNMICLLASHKE